MATLAPVREQAAAGYTYSPIIDVADLKDRQHLSGTGPDDELNSAGKVCGTGTLSTVKQDYCGPGAHSLFRCGTIG